MTTTGAYSAAPPRGDRPLLFLGLAGVIYVEEPPTVAVESVYVAVTGHWRRQVAIPVGTGSAVRELASRFDIVWVSEWGGTAHAAFAPVLGLPDEPWPFLPVQFGKLAVIRHYAGDLNWTWVDDRLVTETPDGAMAERHVNERVIVTDPSRGLAGLDLSRADGHERAPAGR